MVEEQEFDFLCRWCGQELILMREFVDAYDPSSAIDTWWHLGKRGAKHSKECLGDLGLPLLPIRMGEPTRWTECA